VAGESWTAKHLAIALVNEGLGGAAWSGFAPSPCRAAGPPRAPGERPYLNLHYESFFIDALRRRPKEIVLIDDVVTGKDATGRGDPRSRSIPLRSNSRVRAGSNPGVLIPAVNNCWIRAGGKSDGGRDAHRSP